MRVDPARVQLVTQRCREVLGDPAAMTVPRGYPDSLALCLIDAVQSPGVAYGTVESVLDRYRAHRRSTGADPETDGVDGLLDSFDALGVEQWMKTIGTRNRTPPRPGAPFKADAIRLAAEAFRGTAVITTADLRATVADPIRLDQVRASWVGVIGQSTGVTWHYLLMLAGVPGVKPDRMIGRFIAAALGWNRQNSRLTPDEMIGLVTESARELAVSPTVLDHAIWQWQRRHQHAVQARVTSSR